MLNEDIDPITGLTKEQLGQASNLKLINRKNTLLSNNITPGQIDLGFEPVSKYDYNLMPLTKEEREAGVNPISKQFSQRADYQPWTQQALHATGQAVNEAVTGTVASLASIADLPSYIALLNDSASSDQNFHNAVYDWATNLQKEINEKIPIYSNSRFDSGWFWKNLGQTVGSAASFYAPGIGAAKILGKLGEAIKLGTTAKGVLGTLGGAAIMRHAENFQEASNVYDNTYVAAFNKMLNEGKSQEEAKQSASQIAGEAAAHDYKLNSANYVFDVLQLGAVLKPKLSGILGSVERQPYAVLKQANLLPESRIGRLAKWINDPAKEVMEAGSEGLEEIVNQISQNESEREGKIKAGITKDDGTSFLGRLGSYLGSADVQDSFIWGAVGGAAFQGLGHLTGQNEGKAITQNKLAELASRNETLKNYADQVSKIQNGEVITNDKGEVVKDYSKLSDTDKQSAVDDLSKDLAFNLGLNAARVGNTDILLKQLDQQETKQQLIQSGVTNEETIKEKLPEIKKQVELANYLYNKHNNRFFESPVEQIVKDHLTEQSIDIEKRVADNNELIKDLQVEHASILSKDPVIQANLSDTDFMNTLNVTSVRLAKLQAKTQLEELKDNPVAKEQLTKVIDNLEKAEKDYPVTNMKNQAITNFNLVNNLAQQTLATQFNKVLTDQLNTVGSKENIENIQKTVTEVKNKVAEQIKQNKAEVNSKAKEDRIQETKTKKDLLTATDVANKIVNRVDPNEQLTPEEQQFYDNNPEEVEQAISDIQDLKEQEKAFQPKEEKITKPQVTKEVNPEKLPNPFEGGTDVFEPEKSVQQNEVFIKNEQNKNMNTGFEKWNDYKVERGTELFRKATSEEEYFQPDVNFVSLGKIEAFKTDKHNGLLAVKVGNKWLNNNSWADTFITKPKQEENPFKEVFTPTKDEEQELNTEENTGFQDPMNYDKTKDNSVISSISNIDNELSEYDTPKVVDADGNVEIIENKKLIDNGYNATAYLSREYTITDIEGKKLLQEQDNELNKQLDTILLSPDQFNIGDEVELVVNDAYDGLITDPNNIENTIKWSVFVDELKKKYGENYKTYTEYINNVPINYKYKGEVLFHTGLHNLSWINPRNVYGDITQDKENLVAVRKHIVEKGSYKTTILSKSTGKLFKLKDKNSFIPLTEATTDPNLNLAVVNSDQTYRIARGSAESSFIQENTLNKKNLAIGSTVMIVEINQGKYLAIPVKKQKIGESKYANSVKESISTAIEVYLSQDGNNEFAKRVLTQSKIDLTSIEGLQEYVGQFLNNYNTNGQDLQKVHKKLKLSTDQSIFSINNGNIAFKHSGTVYYVGANLQQKKDLFFSKLEAALDNMYLNTNIESLSKNSNLQFANHESLDYKSFVKQTSLSNIKGFETSDGKYSYTIQKVIRLDYSDILESKEEKSTIENYIQKDIIEGKTGEIISKNIQKDISGLKLTIDFNLDDFSELPLVSNNINLDTNFSIIGDKQFNHETGEGFILNLIYNEELKKDVPLYNREKKVNNRYEYLKKLKKDSIDNVNNIRGNFNKEGNFDTIDDTGNYKSTIYLKRLNINSLEDYKKYELKKINERYGTDADMYKEANNAIPLYEEADNTSIVYLNDDGSIQGSLGTVGIEIPSQIRGKGYGKEAYRTLGNYLKSIGLTLKSDPLGHSEAAHRVWKSLLKLGEARIIEGYIDDKNNNFYTSQFEYINTESELPLTSEQLDLLKVMSERLIVPGLDIFKQLAIVNSLTNSVINTMVDNNLESINLGDVFNVWKDKLTANKDSIEGWLTEDNKTHPKYANYERLYNSLKATLDGWNTLTKQATMNVANINGLKYKGQDLNLDEQELSDSERFDYNKSSLENDPKSGLSARVKRFLAGIEDIDKNDNPKKNWLGEVETLDYKVVYNSLQQWTTDLLSPTFDDMLVSIKAHENEFNWVPNMIKKLENLPDQDRKALVNDMINHYFRPIKVMWDMKDNKGGYTVNLQYPSKLSSADTLLNKWKNNFINSDLVQIVVGDYVFDNKKTEEVVKQFEELQKDSKNITKEQLKTWLSNFNIELQDKTWDELAKGNFRIEGKQLSMSDLLTNSYSPFFVLNKSISILSDNKEVEDSNPFDNTAVKRLTQFDARYTDSIYSQMIRTAGKTIYPFNKNTFVSNRILQLSKGDKLNELSTLPFNKYSYWINNQDVFKKNVSIASADLEVLKKHGDRVDDDNELQNLSNSDYEQVVLGLLHASQEDKSGKNERIVSLLYPTQSDKSKAIIVSGLPAFKVNTDENGVIDDETIDRVYDQLVLPEIERITHFQKLVDAGKDINIEGLNKGWNKFYFIPALNNMSEVFIDGKLNPDIQETSIKDKIKDKLRDHIEQLVNQKLNNWKQYGFINLDGKAEYIDNKFIKERVKGVQKNNSTAVNRVLATDAVVQYLVGNANMFMTMIYDPANAYKSKSADPIQQMKDTFINIGKRLASDIAPGSETEDNSEGKYYQAFIADKALDSLNLGQLETLLGKDAKEYTKKGILSEGTNAQEFTTLSEQMTRYYYEGKIDKPFYDSIINTIRDEVNKGNHYYTEAIKTNLSQINPKYVTEFEDMILQVEKPVYVDNKIDPELQHEIRYYIKTSAYALTPELTSGNDLDNIRIAMEKQGISRLAFSSGIKLGNFTNPVSLWNEDGSIKSVDEIDFNNSKVLLNRSGFRIQQLIPYDETKAAINRVSQASKNLFLNIHKIEDFVYNNKHYTGEELEKEYYSLYNQLFDIQKRDFANEIGYDLENNRFINKQESVKQIKKMLIEEATSREYSQGDIEAIELDDSLKFLAFNSSAQRLESLLNSVVQNRVLKVMFPGKSFVLSTEEGYQSKKVSPEVLKNNQIVYTKNWTGQLLPQRIENGVVKPAQAIVPFKFRDNEGNLLHVEDFIDKKTGFIDGNKLPQDLLQMFGMRIPNQGLNSQSWIEIVGFMPHSSGDVIVATRDYLVQMGSDFDVDKLYAYMYSTYLNKKGYLRKYNKSRETISKVVGEEITPDKKELLNSILDIHIAIHSNPNEVVQKQILTPLSAWEFEGIAKKIEESKVDKIEFSPLSDQYQQDKRLNASAGKALVGIFSNVSMFNAVAQNKGIYMISGYTKEGYEIPFKLTFGNKTSNGKLGQYKDLSGKTYISDIISGAQMCAVDNEKLQVCDKFNWNVASSKYINTLMVLGFGEESALFTAQPIIVDYFNRVKAERSSIKDYTPNLEDVIMDQIKKEVMSKIKDFNEDTYKKSFSDGKALSVDNMWKAIKGEENPDRYYIELAALEQLQKMTIPANTLSSVMSAINVDSKGIDKNLLESINKYDNVLRNVLNEGSTIVNSERLLENNINGAATKILKFNNDLWSNIMPYNSKGVQYYFTKILDILGKQDLSISRKAELQKQIFDELKSYLFSNQNLGLSDRALNSERRRLFTEDTNLAKLISELQKQEQWKNHPFIGKLYFEINKNGLPNVVKINAAQEDVVEQATMMGVYDLLLKDKAIEGTSYTTRELMQDLILASYISGGIQQATQYLKYIPAAYIHTIPFADRLVSMVDKFNDDEFMQIPNMNAYEWELPSFITQYFQHNSDKIKKISTENITILSKDKAVEKFSISSEEETPIFLTLKAEKRTKGLSKNYIYIHQGEMFKDSPVYTRIDNLGYTGFKEYNSNIDNNTIAKSVIAENNANNNIVKLENTNTEKGFSRSFEEPEVSVKEQLELEDGDKYVLDNVLENIAINDSIDPYYKLVAAQLVDKYDTDTTIDTNYTKGEGKYTNKVVYINTDGDLNTVSKRVLHETIHSIIDPKIKLFEQGQFKGSQEQINSMLRLKNIFEQYRNKLTKYKYEEFNKFLNDVAKYKNNPETKLEVTPEELSRYYGAINLREFVTMAMTDEGFQRILNEIPFNDNKTWLEKIFEEITNALSKFIGIDIKKGSSLEVAIHDVLGLIENRNYEIVNQQEETQGEIIESLLPLVKSKFDVLKQFNELNQDGTSKKLSTKNQEYYNQMLKRAIAINKGQNLYKATVTKTTGEGVNSRETYWKISLEERNDLSLLQRMETVSTEEIEKLKNKCK